MAATDRQEAERGSSREEAPRTPSCSGVLLAALALPGLLPATAARAEEPPEQAIFAVRHLHYEDQQPGFDRITVDAPSIRLLLPFAEHFAVDTTAVLDSVSGASPRAYSAVSSASKLYETRLAADTAVTWYRPRSAYVVSYARSDEHDYISDAGSLSARFSSDDQNTTFNIGIGGSHDRIDPTNDLVNDARKNTWQAIAGVTRALSPKDLVQLQLSYSSSHGYLDDPYKLYDLRPDTRFMRTAVLRWNHHFEDLGASLRLQYRYYGDSWEVQAHSTQAEWVQPLPHNLTLTPSLRYHTQRAAEFYVDPIAGTGDGNGEPEVPVIPEGRQSSVDQRLGAWGGGAVAVKLAWGFATHWSTDIRAEFYEQRSDWRWGGDGSPGLDTFRATWVEWGLERRF